MNDNITVEIKEAVPRFSAYEFRHPLDWTIREGEHWTVIGPNGAGKSRLISILLERQGLSSGIVRSGDGQRVGAIAECVAFTDIYSIFDAANFYYQQRWNTGDIQTAPFVHELFDGLETDTVKRFIDIFDLRRLFGERVNMLSSGELRKTLIVRSLRSGPRLLILDNPYIGLDAASRVVLEDVFRLLAGRCGIQLITLVADPRDVPGITTHVLPVKDKELLPAMTRAELVADKGFQERLFGKDTDIRLPQSKNAARPDFNNVLEFRNVTVRYGERTILDKIDWSVARGEKWLLTGRNGSGKSTLLSLVFCDNPQAYANDITLFDRPRGAGQSIWEVKGRIGFISPEITNYYRKPVSCLDVVVSGFYDTVGLRYGYDDGKADIARDWMEAFGIGHLVGKSSIAVSAGEYQLVMLARAFVKDPDLLILDEPVHGLDKENKLRVKEILGRWCTDDKTLIYVTHYEEEAPAIITHRLDLNCP